MLRMLFSALVIIPGLLLAQPASPLDAAAHLQQARVAYGAAQYDVALMHGCT